MSAVDAAPPGKFNVAINQKNYILAVKTIGIDLLLAKTLALMLDH
jgi:hypothetical protein